MRANASLPLVVLLLGAACAGSRAGSSAANPNLITTAEIEQARNEGVQDLYELIDRRRPRWLQIRNERSLHLPTGIAVYHNNARLGGPDVLRGYPLGTVTSIRYLDAAAAMQLPGAGSAHIEGAIVISTGIVPRDRLEAIADTFDRLCAFAFSHPTTPEVA